VNSEEKKIKIIDFGIAGAISFFTQKVDGRIDVWATGVILYCMLNATLPFKGANNY